MYKQRIHQQMESEHHGDTRNSDTVVQQQGRVANRVRFASCSDTHNLWLLCQNCALRSAVDQLVILTGSRRLLHSTSSIPSAVFLHPICHILYTLSWSACSFTRPSLSQRHQGRRITQMSDLSLK